MGEAKRLRKTPEYEAGQGVEAAKGRASRQAMRDARTSFEGKTFAELSQPDKDALLKAVAIKLGFIAE